MNKDDGALIFGHEQALSAEDAYNIYLEGRSQHVKSVPEKQREKSDEKAVLCLKYFYLFLKKKNQKSTKLFGAINQYFRSFS